MKSHSFHITRIPSIAGFLLLFASCEPGPSGIIDPPLGSPQLSNLALAFTSVNTDTMNIGPVRLPEDDLSIKVNASLRVLPPPSPSVLNVVSYGVATPSGNEDFQGTLRDDGIAPDVAPNDSLYSGTVEFHLLRSTVGRFLVRVTASTTAGTVSNSVFKPVDIIRANHRPVITEITADSVLSASDPSPFRVLSARVADVDGLADLKTVYFNSTGPNGPSSGNPFILLDNGDVAGPSGDQAAGDGVYSLRVTFSGAPVGTYRFDFRAIDRSMDSSNVVSRSITITP